MMRIKKILINYSKRIVEYLFRTYRIAYLEVEFIDEKLDYKSQLSIS